MIEITHLYLYVLMMAVYRVQSTLADNNNQVQSDVFTLNCCHHHHQLLIIRLDTVIGLNCSIITEEHSSKVISLQV